MATRFREAIVRLPLKHRRASNNGEPLRNKRKIVFSESERSILNNMMLTDESISM